MQEPATNDDGLITHGVLRGTHLEDWDHAGWFDNGVVGGDPDVHCQLNASHKGLREEYTIVNIHNGVTVGPIGSECINLFNNTPLKSHARAAMKFGKFVEDCKKTDSNQNLVNTDWFCKTTIEKLKEEKIIAQGEEIILQNLLRNRKSFNLDLHRSNDIDRSNVVVGRVKLKIRHRDDPRFIELNEQERSIQRTADFVFDGTMYFPIDPTKDPLMCPHGHIISNSMSMFTHCKTKQSIWIGSMCANTYYRNKHNRIEQYMRNARDFNKNPNPNTLLKMLRMYENFEEGRPPILDKKGWDDYFELEDKFRRYPPTTKQREYISRLRNKLTNYYIKRLNSNNPDWVPNIF